MGSASMAGINWSVEDGVFSFFDSCRGYVNDGTWRVTADVFGSLKPIQPMSVKADIEAIIAGDIAAGNGDRIAYVGVGPFQAVVLALEGIITLPLLRAAKEGLSSITMNVILGGVERKLIVLKRPDHDCATYDASHRVV